MAMTPEQITKLAEQFGTQVQTSLGGLPARASGFWDRSAVGEQRAQQIIEMALSAARTVARSECRIGRPFRGLSDEQRADAALVAVEMARLVANATAADAEIDAAVAEYVAQNAADLIARQDAQSPLPMDAQPETVRHG